MARDTSKRPGKPKAKAAPRNAGRARATRPPIIEGKARDISRGGFSTLDTHGLIGAMREKLDHVFNRAAGLFSHARDLAQAYRAAVLATALALVAVVIVAGFYVLQSRPTTTPERGVGRADVLAQQLARQQVEIERVARDMSALEPQLRAQIARQMGANEALLGQHKRRLDGLAEKMDGVAGRMAALDGNIKTFVPALEKKLAGLPKDITAIRNRLSAAETQRQVFAAAVKLLTDRISALEGAMDRLARRAAGLKSDGFDAGTVEMLKAAGGALVAALRSSRPFLEPLEAYAKLMPDDVAVLLLRPHGARGVLTLEQLLSQARSIAAPAASARQTAGDDGLYDGFSKWVGTFIRVRRKSDLKARERHAWTKISRLLEAGDLAGALAAALSLPAPGEARAWIARAQARLLVDRQLGSLKARLDRLDPSRPGKQVN